MAAPKILFAIKIGSKWLRAIERRKPQYHIKSELQQMDSHLIITTDDEDKAKLYYIDFISDNNACLDFEIDLGILLFKFSDKSIQNFKLIRFD